MNIKGISIYKSLKEEIGKNYEKYKKRGFFIIPKRSFQFFIYHKNYFYNVRLLIVNKKYVLQLEIAFLEYEQFQVSIHSNFDMVINYIEKLNKLTIQNFKEIRVNDIQEKILVLDSPLKTPVLFFPNEIDYEVVCKNRDCLQEYRKKR